MPPFESTLEPVALPGEAVRLIPSGSAYRVIGVEQLARLGPIDYGPADANSASEEGGSQIIDLEDELAMDDATLGQIWVNPLSNVEIEIRQQGQQEQRFTNENETGVITPATPANQRVVYVWEEQAPHAIINNPTNRDMQSTLVYYTGYIIHVDRAGLGRGDVESMRGEPATVPVDSLKRAEIRGVQ